MQGYQFSTQWFESVRSSFSPFIAKTLPAKVLEIGSFEGASTVNIIEIVGAHQDLEIVCCDTWEGGIEHKRGNVDMTSVEERFRHNVNCASSRARGRITVRQMKDFSDISLCKLLAHGMRGYFDLAYIDGSHQAPDVLCDAVLAFRLVRPGGFIICDDYLWHEDLPNGIDPIRCPKIALDSFTSIYGREVRILPGLPLYQLYLQKTL